MKKIIVVIAALMMGAFQVSAQQRPQYSQYMLNSYLLNPAVTGIEEYADIRISNRRQWIGIDGAPTTYYVSGHMPLNKGAASTRYHRALAHHGVGGAIHTDKTGPLRQTSVTGSYAYHLPLTNTINASAGAAAGLMRTSLNAAELQFTNPNEPLVGGGDVNRNVIDLSLGLWVYSRNFSVGVAGAQLLKDAGSFSPENNQATLGLQRHYFVTGSYRISAARNLDFIPTVMVKLTDPSPASIDASLRAIYDDRFWVGTSYRHGDALVGMVGVYVSPLLDISYSYDATISDLNRVSAGTHEVVVGFKLFNDRRVICPQWIW